MRFVVIMAGGEGERLWPLSMPERPKPFLRLLGERTMLQETVDRLGDWIPLERTLVVVGVAHRDLVAGQLPDLPPENILVEPIGRGTAACVGLAAVRVARTDRQGVMVVLPADHVIRDVARFRALLAQAEALASSGTHLVTLGITPDHPATGYGYIEAGRPFARDDRSVLTVSRFTEKPDAQTAQSFVAQGNHFWNAGIFVWRVDAIRREIARHLPALDRGLSEIATAQGSEEEVQAIERVYRDLGKVSIDVGVMEKAQSVLALPTGAIGWSDVGDWAALAGLLPADATGNVVQATHTGIDTSNCFILSAQGKKRRIATLGISNLVIVETENTLLVIDKSRAQDVRQLVAHERMDPPPDTPT